MIVLVVMLKINHFTTIRLKAIRFRGNSRGDKLNLQSY